MQLGKCTWGPKRTESSMCALMYLLRGSSLVLLLAEV